MIDSYLTLAGAVSHKITRRKSRFIAFVQPIADEPDISRRLDEVRRTYHDATHHCYAARWLDGDRVVETSHDDGEPSGSAGLPILQQLMGRDLTHVMAVVVRYFGGTKLGVGGLVRAYSDAVAEALDRAKIVRRALEIRVAIRFPAEVNSAVMSIIHRFSASVESVAYDQPVRVDVKLPPSRAAAFCAALTEGTGNRAKAVVET